MKSKNSWKAQYIPLFSQLDMNALSRAFWISYAMKKLNTRILTILNTILSVLFSKNIFISSSIIIAISATKTYVDHLDRSMSVVFPIIANIPNIIAADKNTNVNELAVYTTNIPVRLNPVKAVYTMYNSLAVNGFSLYILSIRINATTISNTK